jgi:hypothetical protein
MLFRTWLWPKTHFENSLLRKILPLSPLPPKGEGGEKILWPSRDLAFSRLVGVALERACLGNNCPPLPLPGEKNEVRGF